MRMRSRSCFLREAKYHCPTCRLPYCSLACFRANVHRACSEPFAQQSARENLSKEDVSVDDAERRKTMELLWRLETGEGVLSDESSDAEHDDGAEHGGDEDVGSDADEMLARLSLADRQRFQSLLRDPSRAARMYFEGDEGVPLWWTERTTLDGTADFVRDVEKLAASNVAVRADLRYNVVAVLLAYAYALRHGQLARLPVEAARGRMCGAEPPNEPVQAPAASPPPVRVPEAAPAAPVDDDSVVNRHHSKMPRRLWLLRPLLLHEPPSLIPLHPALPTIPRAPIPRHLPSPTRHARRYVRFSAVFSRLCLHTHARRPSLQAPC